MLIIENLQNKNNLKTHNRNTRSMWGWGYTQASRIHRGWAAWYGGMAGGFQPGAFWARNIGLVLHKIVN